MSFLMKFRCHYPVLDLLNQNIEELKSHICSMDVDLIQNSLQNFLSSTWEELMLPHTQPIQSNILFQELVYKALDL